MKMVSPDFFDSLLQHNWPGNVRELFQVVEHVFAGCVEASTLFSIHLPPALRIQVARAAVTSESATVRTDRTAAGEVQGELPPWDTYREEMEKNYFQRLMLQFKGDIKSACSFSGISKSKMYRLLKRYE